MPRRPATRPASRPAVTGAALLTAVFALLTAAVAVRWSAIVDPDHRVMRALDAATHRHPAWHRFWLDVSDVVHPTVLRVLAAVTVGVLLVRRRARPALELAVTMIGAAVLSSVLKLAVDRPRPVPPFRLAYASGASFPSGHALTAAAAAVGFWQVLRLVAAPSRAVLQAVALGAAAVVAAVSLSRIFLAVHFLSDVVGGVLVGTAWALLAGPLVARGTGRRPSSRRDRLAFRRDIR